MTGIKKSKNELLKDARLQELEGKTEDAIKSYNLFISKDPSQAGAYNRLMILYRKLKEYKKELAIINQAIAAYEKDFKDDQQTWKKANSKSARLSLSLAKSMGLLNDKGLPVYEESQIISWRKRMETETVQKKIKTPAKPQKKKPTKRLKSSVKRTNNFEIIYYHLFSILALRVESFRCIFVPGRLSVGCCPQYDNRNS
ncbi:tetratricopeptide repeat protein [Sphingobacterium sp.]|uniref:tetratricopeptide repeat protein n=1 Tax=Sphingobacterium sp. TaxID=341027 RepID=UPI002FDD51F1